MKTYLYLAKRDKKGIKLLATFPGNTNPIKVEDIGKLKLPENVKTEILNSINQNRMLYETWMESAENYQKLKENLTRRGFSNLSSYVPPEHFVPGKVEHKIKTVKSMLRKS